MNDVRRDVAKRRLTLTTNLLALIAASVLAVAGPVEVFGEAFTGYQKAEVFSLPAGAGAFDALPDGRIVTLVADEVYVETLSGSRAFSSVGTLPGASFPSWGPAFIYVSPDGTNIAVGNNGGDEALPADFKVGVFQLSTLTGNWFSADHFDATWFDDTNLALTAGEFGFPAMVTLLDTTSGNPGSPTNPVIINNIGGASGGVAFDEAGNLFTGNGFAGAGPSGTGATKAFDEASWMAAAGGGTISNFETDGMLIVDILSAWPIGFDGEGNLYVGGGDAFGSGEGNFGAVVRASAIADALAGIGPADTGDPAQVRTLDPDSTNAGNFYTLRYGASRGELYFKDFSSTVYVYRDLTGIPAVSSWGLVAMALMLTAVATIRLRTSVMVPVPARIEVGR